MRGKLEFSNSISSKSRNIPAYAGKTYFRAKNFWLTEEHPRVCGENVDVDMVILDVGGTSPRMRGKLWWCRCRGVAWRNIPAYAGKTYTGFAPSPWGTEHPRVCGENR